MSKYILTISCPDVKGIVAKVAGFLADNDCFIDESAQYGDASTGVFFMRAVFETEPNNNIDILKSKFENIAQQFNMNWQIIAKNYKPKVLVLCSKQAHCLHHLLYHWSNGHLNIDIPAVISNHTTNQHLVEQHGIEFKHLPISADNKPEQEAKIWHLVNFYNVDLVVLARYMQILSPDLCDKLQGKCINIHHSFLPGFKGAKPYKQAYDRGVKIIGATAHYATQDLDEGPIIEQEVMQVNHSYDASKLERIGQDIENLVLRRAVEYHTDARVLLNGNKTVVFK